MSINTSKKRLLTYTNSILLMCCLVALGTSKDCHSFISIFFQDMMLAYQIEEFKNINDSSTQSLLDKKNPSSQEKKPETPAYTFADLAGDIPEDIREVVNYITDPEPFRRVGAKLPKGILLYGPPGTGKTSIARAIAGEAKAAFISMSGSEFQEIYVGVGPKRVRELFGEAQSYIDSGEHQRAIIFIDEIDAIGAKRGIQSNSESRNTLNELLNQMDGFKTADNITVIAATNYRDILDDALVRPGRFDRHIKIGLPDENARKEIISLYCSKINYQDENSDKTFAQLAKKTKGWTGADLKNMVNEAAIYAAREKADAVLPHHVQKAHKKNLHKK